MLKISVVREGRLILSLVIRVANSLGHCLTSLVFVVMFVDMFVVIFTVSYCFY